MREGGRVEQGRGLCINKHATTELREFLETVLEFISEEIFVAFSLSPSLCMLFFCIRICNCICIFICWLDLCVTKQKKSQQRSQEYKILVSPCHDLVAKRKTREKVRIEKQTEMSHVRDLFLMGYPPLSPSLSFCCSALAACSFSGLFAV